MPTPPSSLANHLQVGRYELVPPASGSDAAPERLILDTNVVIDMERFYFGGADTTAIREDLRALLERFPKRRLGRSVEVIYGFGATEAAWRRGAGFDRIMHRRLTHAAAAIVDWDERQLAKHLTSTRPPARTDKRWPLGTALPAPAAPDDHPLILVLGTYGALLRLCHLDATRARWKERGPLWALTDYVDWLASELGVVGAYETQMGIDLLLGDDERRNGVRRMLKLGGSEQPDVLADRCWNAAWDILFLRITEGATYGLLEDAAESVMTLLVTKNRDPGFVRAQSEIRRISNRSGDPRSVYVSLSWTAHPVVGDTEIAQVLSRHEADTKRRHRDPAKLVTRAVEATRTVEALVGVTRSALAFSPWA